MNEGFIHDPQNRQLLIFIIISLIIHLFVIYGPVKINFGGKKTVIYSPYRVKLIGNPVLPKGNSTVSGSNKPTKKTDANKTTAKKTVVTPKSQPKTKAKVSLSKKKKSKNAKKIKKKKIAKNTRKDESEEFNLSDFKKFLEKKKKEISSKNRGSGVGGSVGSPQGAAEAARGLDILQRVYYNRIIDTIKSSWILPPQLKRERRNLKVVVAIRIDKNGRILKSSIEKSSGNEFYDESALRTISKIRKFPPPPVIKGDFLDIGLIFNLKELQ